VIPDARLQELIGRKDHEEALRWCTEYGYSEGWTIIDGTLVIHDLDNPPAWLVPVLEARDEDGNTTLS